MFGLQPWHFIAILSVALIVLGPSRLPEIGKAIGQSLREFRDATGDVQAEFKKGLAEPPKSESDFANSQVTLSGGKDAPLKP